MLAVIYVDDTAASALHDGSSWTTAHTDLQAALEASGATEESDEIRVASGTYRPTQRWNSGDARSATFSLQNNVRILGGFPNGGGAIDARDRATHVTTLSGNILSPDASDDNSYHVVSAVGVNETAVLDGFAITGGQGDNWSIEHYGGGMYVHAATPTIANCTFTGNWSPIGGGMFVLDASPTLTGCTFRDNTANAGAGMATHEGAAPTLVDCTFQENHTEQYGSGGGMANLSNATATLVRCTFAGNMAYNGGGMMNQYAAVTMSRCTFVRNHADAGGAINSQYSTLMVTDSTFTGNTAQFGGGMTIFDSAPVVTNCAFAGNSASSRGGGMGNVRSAPALANCTFALNFAGERGAGIYNNYGTADVTNCVFWMNLYGGGASADIADEPNSQTTVRHSMVQSGWPGAGNVVAYPLFVRNPFCGADQAWGTADDDYGNLRLRPGSAAIDTGDTAAVPAGITADLSGLPRVRGTAVDMGAFEFQWLTVNGSAGNDTIRVSRSGDQLRVSVNGATKSYAMGKVDKLVLDGLAGNDRLWIENSVNLPAELRGGAGNDVLHGSRAADHFYGGSGNDTVDYSDRTENLQLGIGSSADDGASGENDNIHSDVENLVGGSGSDILRGGGGASRLVGGAGNDRLFGNYGDDILDGGLGADYLSGGPGRDTLDYALRTAPLRIGLGTLADDGEAGEGDNAYLDNEVILGGSGNDRLSSTTLGARIEGRAGSDTLIGSSGVDALFGGSGDDSIDGGGGNDYLEGQAGHDTMRGGSGLDRLLGNDGDDWLYARDGARDSVDGGMGFDRAQVDLLRDLWLGIQLLIA